MCIFCSWARPFLTKWVPVDGTSFLSDILFGATNGSRHKNMHSKVKTDLGLFSLDKRTCNPSRNTWRSIW